MRGQAFKAPKVTKRQRKALRHHERAASKSNRFNETMVESCIKNGKRIMLAGATYIGAVPEFFNKNMNNPTLPAEFVKTSKGIPFVRVA
ncbi:MAG: hypothetical protein ACR2M9_03640 [Cyanophyceae cyanobacterium]